MAARRIPPEAGSLLEGSAEWLVNLSLAKTNQVEETRDRISRRRSKRPSLRSEISKLSSSVSAKGSAPLVTFPSPLLISKLRRGGRKGTSSRNVDNLRRGSTGKIVGTCSRCRDSNSRLDTEQLCGECVRVALPRDPNRVPLWLWFCNRWWKV